MWMKLNQIKRSSQTSRVAEILNKILKITILHRAEKLVFTEALIFHSVCLLIIIGKFQRKKIIQAQERSRVLDTAWSEGGD